MSHIIEYTKHSDNYLVYHFEFECNDDIAIGKYAGNCSLNKFMSLNDWHQVINILHESVEYYIQNPLRKPIAIERKIDSTNFHLQITWTDMDVNFYSKLLYSIDFDSVFPFVINVKIFQCSNLDKFKPANKKTSIKNNAEVNEKPDVTPVKKKSFIVPKKTPKENIDKSIEVKTTPVLPVQCKLRDCCVRLPLLQFDKNGEVIQQKKRKFSQLNEMNEIKFLNQNHFIASSSSTPLAKNLNAELKCIESEVRETFDERKTKTIRHSTNRYTRTPHSSNKTGLQYFPKLRLRLDTSTKSAKKMTTMKTIKKKPEKVKGMKKKPISIDKVSELFGTIEVEAKKIKKLSENRKDKKNLSPNKIIDTRKSDLKLMSDSELLKSFDEHNKMISDLFHGYLKQTDAKVRKSSEFHHFDMISLVTTDQFSIMLDILYEKFVKISEFGEICYDSLFLELIVPEWTLAIYMKRHALDRKTAIEQIHSNKTKDNQNYDGYTSIVSIKLDESMITSKK